MAGGQALEASRSSYFWLGAMDITIIGLDTSDGPEHLLYDASILEPLDEAFVENIRRRGIKNPVWLWKDGETIHLVAGRDRVRAVRKINEGLADNQLVPAIVQKGSLEEMHELMVLENACRRNLDPIARAKLVRSSLDRFGKQRTAEIFGKSQGTIDNWLLPLDASADVQKLVSSGEVSQSAAAALTDLPRAEQMAVADEIKAKEGKVTAKAVRERDPKKKREATALRALKEAAILWANDALTGGIENEITEYARAVKASRPKLVKKIITKAEEE